jgi:hypothetical protein
MGHNNRLQRTALCAAAAATGALYKSMKTKQDFEDATAFELLLLQTILNAGESSSKEIIDLADSSGGITRHLCSGIALSDNDVNALKVKFIPLGFGAGWKVIDLMIEHEIALAGLPTPSRGYLPISTKKEYAATRAIRGISFQCEQQTWDCLFDLYSNTVEHRNSLVHRTAQVDWATGSLNGTDRLTKQALVVLTREEQLAFANAAVLAAKGVIDSKICQRDEAFPKHYLNQLMHHSKASIIAGASAPQAIAVKIPLESDEHGLFVDLESQLNKLTQQLSTCYFDVYIRHPTNLAIKMWAKSELMPRNRVYIDIEAPPGWLHIV